jgi:hypothetical protein
MNYRFIIIGLMPFLLCECSNIAVHQRHQQTVCSPVDSVFLYYFSILDSALSNSFTKTDNYPIHRIDESITFMEQITEINSTNLSTFVGYLKTNKDDVAKWKDWYAKNRARLLWNSLTKQVEVVKPK